MSVWIGVSPPSTLLRPIACALLRFTPDLALAPESIILMDVTASLQLFGGIRRLRAQVRQVLAAFGAAPAALSPAMAADPPLPVVSVAAPDVVPAAAPAASAVVSVAASGPAAWLLARSGRGGSALTQRSLQRALAQTPLAVAPPARPFADWFRDLGCETLADLQRLPRVGLKKRCGPALLDWLDQLDSGLHDQPPAQRGPAVRSDPAGSALLPGGAAQGSLLLVHGSASCAMPYRRLELPPAFDAAFELPDHIEHAPALQWAVQRLILQLCSWLAGRQQDAAAFTVLLEHERRPHHVASAQPSTQERRSRLASPADLWARERRQGRAPFAEHPPADEPTALPITLGAPSRDPAILTRLVQEHLARLILPASVIAVRLKATQFQTAQAPSMDLFPEPGGTPQDHAQLLELLGARLGAENLLAPAPVADHRPECAARWAPLSQAPSGRCSESTLGGRAARPAVAACGFLAVPLPRPAWLLDAPVPLAVRGHRPVYGTPLRLVSPAERLDCGWQDGYPVTRDYFVAEDESGICYWIFRSDTGLGACGQTGAAPGRGPAPHWFLHGLFG